MLIKLSTSGNCRPGSFLWVCLLPQLIVALPIGCKRFISRLDNVSKCMSPKQGYKSSIHDEFFNLVIMVFDFILLGRSWIDNINATDRLSSICGSKMFQPYYTS